MKPITVLRSITCHMESHTVSAVTRHRWTCPTLTPTRQADNQLTYCRGMKDERLSYEGRAKSFEPKHIRLIFFRNLYISEKCTLYWLRWVCCRYEVIV